MTLNRNVMAAIGGIALASCGQASGGTAAAQEAPASPAAQLTPGNIAPTRYALVEDQFIECAETTPNGNTSRQFFLIKGGAVKSYSQMQNFARDMCDPGQPGCALGWYGEKVGLFFETGSGAVNQMLLDLETLQMEKVLTTATNGAQQSAMICERGPFPDGVVID